MLPAATGIAVLGSAGIANAATFQVTTTTDSSDGACTTSLCSLRDAVQAANTNGGANTINVPAGIYDLTTSPYDLEVNSGANDTSIAVNGAGSGSTILNVQEYSRIFSLDSGGGLTLTGLTLENGAAGDGGAIYSSGALTINGDVVFKGNASTDGSGGAIYAGSGSSLAITGATFNGNNTNGDGGAIEDYATAPGSISQSNFFNNGAGNGGAIAGESSAGSLNIDSSHFSQNTSYKDSSCCGGAYDGGGIYWDSPNLDYRDVIGD